MLRATAIAQPATPPNNPMNADSPRIIASTSNEENPRVFRIPTSRIRSRTDMEMVLAETSRILKVTAPPMARRKTTRMTSQSGKKPAMPGYLRRRERPWFRSAHKLLKRVAA